MTHHGRQQGWPVNQGAAVLAQVLAPTEAPPLAPQPQSFDWVGGRDGNGDWNTARNWNPAQVPGASATVTFATGLSGYTVTGDATISGITVDGDGVTFDGAITEATGGSASFLTVSNGGQVTLDQNSFVTGQGIDFADGTLLDVEGTLIASGGSADVAIVEGLEGDMIVAGTLDLNQLYVQTGGSYTGNLTLNNDGSVTIDTSSSFGGGLVTLLGTASIYAAAAPEATGGTVGIGDAIDTGGAGSYLEFGSDPDVTLALGGPISGDGALIVTGGSVELQGVDTYTGITDVMGGGTLTIDQPGSILSDLIFLNDGAFVNVSNVGGTLVVPYQDTVVAGGSSDTVDAGGGGVFLWGGVAAALTFVGGATTSTVIGGPGTLTATGGSAGDLIFGGTSGHDMLYSGAGNSTLVGGAGASLFGDGAGNAVLVAGGNNVLADCSQDTGTVTVFGATGDAISVEGGAGTVYAVVNTSDATIYGGHGTITAFSTTGSLALDYVVGFGGGTTNVIGFNVASDLITLFGYTPGTAQQAFASETVNGGNTYLELADGTHINLFGVTDLTAANFASV
jgi:hypothetical protein